MRSAGDWEAANRPERACIRSAFVAASKPIYVRDQNDCDEAPVSVYRTSLVCRWPLCYGVALCKDWQIWFVPL
jgi:hypothetical protein